MLSLTLCSALLLSAAGATPTAPSWIELAPANQEHGLSVPSAGDGSNTAELLGGSPCRRITGPKSLYLYVKADGRLVPAGCYDAYLAVEYFDERPSVVHVEYDKAPVVREKNSFYTHADDLILSLGTNEWRRAVIRLADARFGHGQNFGADLRLACAGIAVRKIEVTFNRPADYRPGGIDPVALEKVRMRAGPGMELDMGCDASAGEAALFRALGFTSVESYVTWQTVEDAGEGQWDWSRWDRQVEILQAAGLKWAPLLVAGPAYATPKWYRESEHSVGYVCLEHGQPTKIQSLWNPQLRHWIERFVRAFSEHYRDRGVIELVRLGSTGTYGETLYPSGPPDGWTFLIPGMFHNHRGWWAGDRFAIASFRGYLARHYGDIATLNRAWGTQLAGFDAIVPVLPEKAPSLRARIDMVNWYVDSMTEFGAFWAATVRKFFPHTPIYQSLGGAGEPVLGADFSAQARALAPFGARVRVTNEGSDYAQNFAVTREVVSSARAFGLDYGFEPAGRVSADGIAARLYNATASGGIHFFSYKGNLLQDQASLATFRKNVPLLERRTPIVHAALYLPKTSWALDEAGIRPVLAAARALRDRVDFELLDRTTMATPLAQRVKVLAIVDAPYAEAADIEALRSWVAAGGILVASVPADRPLLRTPEGNDALRETLLAQPPAGMQLMRPTLRGRAPRHFRLNIGTRDDSRYLCGDWHSPEGGGMFPKIPGSTMRWTQARAGMYLPCDPSADATLALTVNLTSHSLPGVNRVLINGAEVGILDKEGVRTYRFAVSKARLAGRPVAHVALEIQPFSPAKFGAHDTRELGAAVSAAEMCVRGAESEPCTAASLVWEIDWPAAAACTRRVGQGATLAVPDHGAAQFNEAVVQTLVHPENFVPGARAVPLPLPEIDGVYATQLTDGVLYYNAADQACVVNGVEVPAHGIAHQRLTPPR